MRDVEFVGMRPIPSHQQPAGKPRLNDMEAGAHGRLRQLGHHHVNVALQASVQRAAMLELTTKWLGVHPPGRAGALDQGAGLRNIHAEHQRGAQHALVADEADLHAVVATGRSNQGDETARREEDMANALARLLEHVGQGELDRLAACEQMAAVLTGQGRKQPVVRRSPRRFFHGESLAVHAREAFPMGQHDDADARGSVRWPTDRRRCGPAATIVSTSARTSDSMVRHRTDAPR